MTALSTNTSTTPPSRRQEFLGGVRGALPLVVGGVPFGLIYGVSALGAHLTPAQAQGMSSILFAGSAQFVAAQLFGSGTPVIVIILTVAIINLRHALYSASLAPNVRDLRPRSWRWLLAYLLTDEAYAATIVRYQVDDVASPYRHWFFFGAGFAMWGAWQISTAVGIFLGASIPPSWGLDFALPLTFIAIVVPALRDRTRWITAVVAGVVVLLASVLPFKLGLIVATIVAIAAGVLVDTRKRVAR